MLIEYTCVWMTAAAARKMGLIVVRVRWPLMSCVWLHLVGAFCNKINWMWWKVQNTSWLCTLSDVSVSSFINLQQSWYKTIDTSTESTMLFRQDSCNKRTRRTGITFKKLQMISPLLFVMCAKSQWNEAIRCIWLSHHANLYEEINDSWKWANGEELLLMVQIVQGRKTRTSCHWTWLL